MQLDPLPDAPSTDLVQDLSCLIDTCPISGLPVTTTSSRKTPTSYLNCPTRAFIDYGADEVGTNVDAAWLRVTLTGVIRAMRPVVKLTGWDDQVQINNWLLSTNPMPELDFDTLSQMSIHHQQRHPEKAVIIRSLNERQHSDTMTFLATLGYRMIPNRQVYLWRYASGDRLSRDLRRDLKLMSSGDLDWVNGAAFTSGDWARAAQLYSDLYLGKHSTLNPGYTETFLSRMHAAGHIDTHGLRSPCGRLLGIVGMCEKFGTLTAPVVGYDQSELQERGLYRQLMAKVFSRAMETGQDLNLSAGAAGFKRNRGAEPEIEYMAVLDAHLPKTARCAGGFVEGCLRRIGIPVMRQYQL